MIVLDVNKLAKNFGYGQLFEDVSFTLNDGESISIVGPNGCGKSTLLKMIAGLVKVESGAINIRHGAKVAYLDQTGSSVEDGRTPNEIFSSVFVEINELEARINKIQNKLCEDISDSESAELSQKYCDLLEKFAEIGGYEKNTQIRGVIDGLKIDNSILNQPFNTLSGGEKTLVGLARTLLIKPDLLLLDEPTNHLDIARIEWLENYIKDFRGATVIVSHDRYFLDKMSNKILSLDNGRALVYTGNYSAYLNQRERDFEIQMAQYRNDQMAIKRLEEQIKYFAQMGMAKNSSTMCDRAHALTTQLNRLKQSAAVKPKKAKRIKAEFEAINKNSKRVLEVSDLKVSTGEKVVLNGVNLQINAGERVAFIGSNGSGKSTLIKVIMSECDLSITGSVVVGPSVKIGYLPQIIQFKNESADVLEYFKDAISVPEQQARAILASFGFYQQDVSKKVKNLSGGEKIKLKLAELLQEKYNTLIFDEPTNHIDIETKEVLEEALENFEGTLIFVSHDRFFINKFADKVIEFENGKTTTYLGDYDFYKAQKRK